MSAEHSMYFTARTLLAIFMPCSRLMGDNPCAANPPIASLFSRKSILVPVNQLKNNANNKNTINNNINYSNSTV